MKARKATNISTIVHNNVEDIIHPKNRTKSDITFKKSKYSGFIFSKKYFKLDSPS